MKTRVLAAALSVALMLGLLPAPAAAAADADPAAVYLLAEGFPEESLSEEEMEQGTAVSEEDTSTLFPGEEQEDGGGGIAGVRNVLVAAVRFRDEPEFVDWAPSAYGGRTVGELMKLTYDGTDRSVSDYYAQQSFGRLQIRASFLNGGQSSIQLSHDRGYYEPLSLDNPQGYLRHVRAVRIYGQDGRYTGVTVRVPELACQRAGDVPDHHVWLEDGELIALCEHMEARAVRRTDGRLELHCRLTGGGESGHSWTDSTCFYSGAYQHRMDELDLEVYLRLNALAHEQGIGDIDCVNLWYSGMSGEWSDILWPHQSYFDGWGLSFFRDGGQKRYIQQFSSELLLQPVAVTTDGGEKILLPELGTVTHELGHMLGFPDYYSYRDQTMGTMGTWTLMCNQSLVPQNIHAWAAYTYGKWLEPSNVREITEEGYYTLTTISGATRAEQEAGLAFAYYIENPAADPAWPEQIVLEYRTGRGAFEGSEEVQGYRAADGVILYSVDAAAEQRLAGNMGATGRDGRFGARMYWIGGAAAPYLAGYEEMSQGLKDVYDMIFSVLTDQPFLHAEEDPASGPGCRSFGSPDRTGTERALISRRTGKNSGIVVCSPTTEPGRAQMTVWVDLDEPEVTAVRESGGTVVLCFDEPVGAGAELDRIAGEAGPVSARVENTRLILSGLTAGETVTVPARAVADQAGRGMKEDYTLTVTGETEGESEAPLRFSDVPEDHWAAEAIGAVTGAGLFQGVAPSRFQPEGTLTRAMFVTALGRLAGVEAEGGETGFSDVDPEAWYAPYVRWAAETGVAAGMGGGTFAPEEAVTREQLAVMLDRFLTAFAPGALAEVGGLPFEDQRSVSSWAQQPVRTLSTNGLLNGTDGQFRPSGLATRAEAAALLSRCMGMVM